MRRADRLFQGALLLAQKAFDIEMNFGWHDGIFVDTAS